MTEDMLPEARRVMLPEAITGGAFYGMDSNLLLQTHTFPPLECPNGHPYFVGEVSELGFDHFRFHHNQL